MKWLATILCLLTVNVANAEPPETPTPNPAVALPLMMTCTPKAPDEMLLRQYGEIGFLEGNGQIFIGNGRAVNGKFRFFLNPDDAKSFTVIFEVAGEMHCMLISGDNVEPMRMGDPI